MNNMTMTEKDEEENDPLLNLLHSDVKDGSVDGIHLAPELMPEQQKECREVQG